MGDILDTSGTLPTTPRNGWQTGPSPEQHVDRSRVARRGAPPPVTARTRRTTGRPAGTRPPRCLRRRHAPKGPQCGRAAGGDGGPYGTFRAVVDGGGPWPPASCWRCPRGCRGSVVPPAGGVCPSGTGGLGAPCASWTRLLADSQHVCRTNSVGPRHKRAPASVLHQRTVRTTHRAGARVRRLGEGQPRVGRQTDEGRRRVPVTTLLRIQ